MNEIISTKIGSLLGILIMLDLISEMISIFSIMQIRVIIVILTQIPIKVMVSIKIFDRITSETTQIIMQHNNISAQIIER
jgi:hypothetical protein